MPKKKMAHLEMIQGVITRMASNSFALKKWGVALVAGVLAIAGKESESWAYLIALVPVTMFWFLDSLYLQLERKFRCLYDCVRLQEEKNVDFSMKYCEVSIAVKDSKKLCYFSSLFSLTEAGFYLPLAMPVVIAFFYTIKG